MIIGWIIASVANFFLFTQIHCQFSDNTPPVVWLERNWVLPDSETVGNIVTRVSAKDTENDVLTYGLERPANFNGDDNPQPPLPFRIDPHNGTIFINDTLKGRGGQNFLLYVTVFDGQLTAKTEVLVNIKNSSAIDYDHTRSPFPSQHGNRGHIHPPPLIINNSPNYPRPPPLPNGEKTTRLRPENHINYNNNYHHFIDTKHTDSAISTKVPSVSTNKILTTIESEKKLSDIPTSQDITMTLVPIAAICALILGLSMGIWSVRGKLCGQSSKSKHDTKEQTSVRVSNISDEPSLSLKSWRNPKLRMNKYQEWHRETQVLDQNKKLSDDKWEFPRHRLKVFSILGEGCFGQVWKCEALDIGDKSGLAVVAVKTLKENATERERIDLAQELKVMKTLEAHPNVVKLLGCCTEREPIFVILEYVSGGKLQSFLRASREERSRGGPGLTSSDLTGFVYQVAKGMEYLASKGIIHRDLAARNVLIDENRVCKVADFGFARDVAANKIYERKSEGRLPIRWMAPESLYDNIFSVKSDIWSFGVLIWEIVTLGSTPYPGMAAADVMKKIKEGYRLDRPEHCKRELYNIMYYCWDKDPKCRPTFGELVAMTEGLLLDEIDYIELDRFPDHSYYNVLSLSGEKL